MIIWLDRRYRLGGGRVLALYVMGYTLGRGWIEMLRIDTVQMNNVLGLRLNVWTSIVLFVLAAAYFVWAGRRGITREEDVYVEGHGPERRADDGRRHRFVCGLAPTSPAQRHRRIGVGRRVSGPWARDGPRGPPLARLQVPRGQRRPLLPA